MQVAGTLVVAQNISTAHPRRGASYRTKPNPILLPIPRCWGSVDILTPAIYWTWRQDKWSRNTWCLWLEYWWCWWADITSAHPLRGGGGGAHPVREGGRPNRGAAHSSSDQYRTQGTHCDATKYKTRHNLSNTQPWCCFWMHGKWKNCTKIADEPNPFWYYTQGSRHPRCITVHPLQTNTHTQMTENNSRDFLSQQ